MLMIPRGGIRLKIELMSFPAPYQFQPWGWTKRTFTQLLAEDGKIADGQARYHANLFGGINQGERWGMFKAGAAGW
jgi:hypothetical protein